MASCYILYRNGSNSFAFGVIGGSSDYYYSFDFYDGASGNGGWHGCSNWIQGGSYSFYMSSSGKFINTAGSVTDASGTTAVASALSSLLFASDYSSIPYIRGRFRVATGSTGAGWDGTWNYSYQYFSNPCYVVTPTCPDPTSVIWSVGSNYVDASASIASGYTLHWQREIINSSGSSLGWTDNCSSTSVSSLSAYYKVRYRVEATRSGYNTSQWVYAAYGNYGQYFIMPPTPSSCTWWEDTTGVIHCDAEGSASSGYLAVDKRINGGTWRGNDYYGGGELSQDINSLNVGDTVQFRVRFYGTTSYYVVSGDNSFGWCYSTIYTKQSDLLPPTLEYTSSTTNSAILTVGYQTDNPLLDHVKVYCGNTWYTTTRSGSHIVSITGLSPGQLYLAYAVGYNASESETVETNNIDFETYPLEAYATISSGFPTANVVELNVAWGQGTYQSKADLYLNGTRLESRCQNNYTFKLAA
jgi:hypothetical protein